MKHVTGGRGHVSVTLGTFRVVRGRLPSCALSFCNSKMSVR